jgi:hypothetical protein
MVDRITLACETRSAVQTLIKLTGLEITVLRGGPAL